MFQIVKKKIKYENIQKDKTEFEKTLKNKSKTPEEKRQAIVEIFTTYRNDFDAIETLLGIINKNTSKEDSEKAKQEALQAFKDSLKGDYSADNVKKALQETINGFYPKDNDRVLQDCLVNLKKSEKNIQATKTCYKFDNNNIGLVYGLGVCRHMATLVNYLIKNLNKQNIQACSTDDVAHAWNYLRFKNGDNSYTYYKVDTYNSIFVKLDNEEEILEAFEAKYGDKVSIDSAFKMACS